MVYFSFSDPALEIDVAKVNKEFIEQSEVSKIKIISYFSFDSIRVS